MSHPRCLARYPIEPRVCRSLADSASSSHDQFCLRASLFPALPCLAARSGSSSGDCASPEPCAAWVWLVCSGHSGCSLPGVHRTSLPGWMPDMPSACHICCDFLVSDPHFLFLVLYTQSANSSIPSASAVRDLIFQSISSSVATALHV